MPSIHIHAGSDLENSITFYHIFKLQLTLASAVTWLALRLEPKPDNFVYDWCECSRRAIKKAVAFISSTTAIQIFRELHLRWLFLKEGVIRMFNILCKQQTSAMKNRYNIKVNFFCPLLLSETHVNGYIIKTLIKL